MEDDYITYEQAAQVLGLKVNTLYSMVATKRVPHVRLGPRLVRFSRKALAEWLCTHAVQPTEPATGKATT
ncbi:MAG: helix-turn-helix domain-containing protein [Polyangiaceae bacterium]|nr:helix-turn-helix domain-containing protein [Polyangiaceae bacterium]